MNAMQKSQYFSYLRADGRIHDNVPEAGGRAEGSDREHGAELLHLGSSAGPRAWSRWSSWSRELLEELRQRHGAEHPHLHHLQLLPPRGM